MKKVERLFDDKETVTDRGKDIWLRIHKVLGPLVDELADSDASLYDIECIFNSEISFLLSSARINRRCDLRRESKGKETEPWKN